MCHSHCDKQVIRDKLTAMKECYLNSSVPPKLHIDIPQHMADAILRKEVGPYVFREAQATVFRYLYGYWQDYQLMSHNLSPEKIAPAIDKMKKQMMELRKVWHIGIHQFLMVFTYIQYKSKKTFPIPFRFDGQNGNYRSVPFPFSTTSPFCRLSVLPFTVSSVYMYFLMCIV